MGHYTFVFSSIDLKIEAYSHAPTFLRIICIHDHIPVDHIL